MDVSLHREGAAPASTPGLPTLLREDVARVLQRAPTARHLFAVITTCPGVHAIVIQRITHRLWRTGLPKTLPELV